MGIIKKQYDTIDGRMIGYHASGVQKDFLTDALGSVTAEVDQSCTKTFEGRYKPYGGDLASDGQRGRFGWIGTWGYRETDLISSSHYIRARHYSVPSGNWTSSDPLWPNERALKYIGNPVAYIDGSGLAPSLSNSCMGMDQNWGGAVSECLNAFCKAVSSPELLRKIKKCASDNGITNVNFESCFKSWCAASPIIMCDDCKDKKPSPVSCLRLKRVGKQDRGQWTTVAAPPNCPSNCEIVPYSVPDALADTRCKTGKVRICKSFFDGTYQKDCDCKPGKPFGQPIDSPMKTLLHELLHVCGKCNGLDNDKHQGPFDAAADCVKKVVGCR